MKGKILQVCAIDLTVDKLLRPLILESEKNGYETHVACTDTGLFDNLKGEISHLHDIRIDRKINIKSNLKSILDLYRLIKKEKFDIVHVHTPIAALLGRIAAKLAGVKSIVYTAHGFYFHDDMTAKQYKIYYWIEKYAAKFLTDWLLLQSEEDYQLAVRDNFIQEARIIHLSNGVEVSGRFNPENVNLEEINGLRKELGIKDTDIVFSFIGRLVEEKGVIELLRSFKKISHSYPNAKLLLIGDLPSSERDTHSINEIKALMNQENVLYLRFRNDIYNLLYMSNVFVLPSYREGLPRSIIEAMAMKNAIIATNIRGCREQVKEGVNGHLVERKSVDELTYAMKEIIEGATQIASMAEDSRKFAVSRYNEEVVLKKQLTLFDKLVEKGSVLYETNL